MNPRNTCTLKAHPRGGRLSAPRSAAGFSLTELVITTAMLSIIVGAAAMLFMDMSKGHISQQDVAEMQQNERFAMDAVLRAVRGAGNNPSGLAFERFDLDPDGDGQFNSLRLRSDFNPPDGALDDPDEVLLFSVAGGVLQVTDEVMGRTTELAQNVAGITFLYMDAAGNQYPDVSALATLQYTDPDTGSLITNLGSLSTVQVTIAGISTRKDLRTKANTTFNLTDRVLVRSGS